MDDLRKAIDAVTRQVITAYPAVRPYLVGRARWIAATRGLLLDEVKTVDGLTRQVANLAKDLREGGDIGAFLDGMAEVIQEQLTRAFRAALRDNDLDPELVTQDGEGFADELEQMILDEFDYVDNFAADIQAGMSDEELNARAFMWGNRYNEAYNEAVLIIGEQYGEFLEWTYGDADHCDECAALNGTVARAKVWEDSGIKPQNPGNDYLGCGGWRCQCSLDITDREPTVRTADELLAIVGR